MCKVMEELIRDGEARGEVREIKKSTKDLYVMEYLAQVRHRKDLEFQKSC